MYRYYTSHCSLQLAGWKYSLWPHEMEPCMVSDLIHYLSLYSRLYSYYIIIMFSYSVIGYGGLRS